MPSFMSTRVSCCSADWLCSSLIYNHDKGKKSESKMKRYFAARCLFLRCLKHFQNLGKTFEVLCERCVWVKSAHSSWFTGSTASDWKSSLYWMTPSIQTTVCRWTLNHFLFLPFGKKKMLISWLQFNNLFTPVLDGPVFLNLHYISFCFRFLPPNCLRTFCTRNCVFVIMDVMN